MKELRREIDLELNWVRVEHVRIEQIASKNETLSLDYVKNCVNRIGERGAEDNWGNNLENIEEKLISDELGEAEIIVLRLVQE